MPSHPLPFQQLVRRKFAVLCTLVVALLVPPLLAQQADKPVDFNRHIRPILSDRCFLCHGPDISTREADLRLDERSFAIAEVIIPGDAANSELMVRISDDDADERMPPVDTHKPRLTKTEIEYFRKWIDEGALYETHWALVPPQATESLPKSSTRWGNGAIDQFILASLEANEMRPSPRAARHTLLRRVTFDLTGLPPTPGELRAFLNDTSPDAYRKVVNRLLQSARYGEHMGRYWLDAARYADTHGLHLDNYREMFPYRDWVVRAFNDNLPYDQFITEQIAGDLLPDATRDQKIASGFNRCHVTTNEGGSINEEVRVRNVYDRVDTFGTIFWGMTVGCAKCHDHKFDPISQKEYFEVYAFFNSLDAKAMDGNTKTHAPVVKVPSEEQATELQQLQTTISSLTASVNGPLPKVDAAQKEWETTWLQKLKDTWDQPAIQGVSATNGTTLTQQQDGSVLASGKNPDKESYHVVLRTDACDLRALRLEALTHPTLGQKSLGRKNGNFVLSEIEAEVTSVADPNASPLRLHFTEARATFSQEGYPVKLAIDGKLDASGGWAVDGHKLKEDRTALFLTDRPFGFEGGTLIHVHLRFESRFSGHTTGRFRLSVTGSGEILPESMGPWYLLEAFTADSGGAAFNTDFGPETGVDLSRSHANDTLHWVKKPEFVDAKTHSLAAGVGASYLYRVIDSPSDREVGVSLGSDDGIRVWLNGIEVLSNQVSRGVAADQESLTLPLKQGENALLMKIVNTGGAGGFYFRRTNESTRPSFAMTELLAQERAARSQKEQTELKMFFRRVHSPAWGTLADELSSVEKKEKELDAKLPTTLVYRETKKPRQAHLLKRGVYSEKGEAVTRSTPKFLPDFPDDLKRDRLGLARWLLLPEQPLTARVAVNRFWLQVFGRGLVVTAENFGNQGSIPSHPKLLDWLSVQFRNGGWDVKDLMKRIVMSETYQQSSSVTPALAKADPANSLLARGPRFRLDAEMIRDQALELGGLLVNQIGGPSVKPPQPDGLWFAVGYSRSNTAKFKADTGHRKVHRRSLYTFIKRTSAPPQMIDAPTRETCVVRRERTNSPLHALLLMNDPQFIEAARGLARRMMTEAGATPAEMAAYGYALATGHQPSAVAADVLLTNFADHLEEFRRKPAEAKKLNSVGLVMKSGEQAPEKLAAWTMVANLILNLDEVLNKN